MKVSSHVLSQLYTGATARSTDHGARCISEEALARAAAGEIGKSERAQLADHLSTCSDCAREYRLAVSLGSWVQQAARATADADTPPDTATGFPGATPVGKRAHQLLWSRVPLLSALAASLLVVTVSLSAWVVALRKGHQLVATRLGQQIAALNRDLENARQQLAAATGRGQQNATEVAALRRDLDALSQPQLNEPLLDLDPRDSTRGPAAHTPRTLSIPAAAAVFTLILNTREHPTFPDYSLQVVDQNGRILWAGRGLHKSRFDTFTVAFPRRLLPPGRYRLTLYGLRGPRRDVVEDYEVIFHYQ